MHKNPQAGFSLVELMVAMVITLIITGAMYGLLTGGQSAFTTQPERTDRQQNMRAAMDIIMRDVASAGTAMPNFLQTFTPNLNGDSNATLGSEVGPSGSKWDELEIFANTSGFGPEYACHTAGDGSSTQVRLTRSKSHVGEGPIMIFFMDGSFTVYNVTDTSANKTGAANCDASVPHHGLNFNTGASDTIGMNKSKGVCQANAFNVGNAGDPAHPPDPACNNDEPCCQVNYVLAGTLVHYKIQDDAQGLPNLMRSENGGPFQVLARGIEDLQVQYVRSDGAVSDAAPTVVNNDYTSLITQVRVQLFARAVNTRIQGAVTTTDTSITHAQGTALRGAMSAQASPRQALWVLTQESPAPVTPRWN